MTKNTNTAACVKMKEEKDEASILSILIILIRDSHICLFNKDRQFSILNGEKHATLMSVDRLPLQICNPVMLPCPVCEVLC